MTTRDDIREKPRIKPADIAGAGADAMRRVKRSTTSGSAGGWCHGRTLPCTAHPRAHYGSGVFEGIRCYETEHGPAASG